MYNKDQIKAAWELAAENDIRYFGAVGSNSKTIKSDKKTNYLSYIMYLAPSNQSGRNVCPMASPGCAQACLFTAGHGAFQSVKDARIRRTNFWFDHRNEFKICIFSEIQKHVHKCKETNKRPACRLNGTSDIIWERQWPELFEYFKEVQFYDYTKIYPRLMKGYKLPKNYHLTLSRSETNEKYIDRVLKSNPKANVTVVFEELPKLWHGRKVIDGDFYDARFLDPKGVIVGLSMKGDARDDESGFVVRSQLVMPTIKKKELI